MREPLEPVGDERLVDRRVERPARRRDRPSRAAAGRRGAGSGSRSRPRSPSAGRPGRPASGDGLEELAAERPDREVDADGRRELGRPGPAGDHEHVTVDLLRGDTARGRRRRARTRVASSSRATAGGSATPSLQQHVAPSTSRVVEACDDGWVDTLDRNAERRSAARAAPRGPQDRPRSSRRRDSRPGGRSAGRARRGTRCSRARARPLPRSRTAGARRPSRARSSRRRARRVRRRRRHRRRAARGGTRRWRRSRPSRRRLCVPFGDDAFDFGALVLRSDRAAAGVLRRAPEHRAARAPSSPRRGTEGAAVTRAGRRRALPPPASDRRTSGTTASGKAAGETRHGTDRAAGDALRNERLGPDEDVEPLDQVRLELLPRRVGDLEAGEVRRLVAQSCDHLERDRVTASRSELVDVERQRCARCRCRSEVLEELVGDRARSTAVRSRRPRPRRRAPHARRASSCRQWTARRNATATWRRAPGCFHEELERSRAARRGRRARLRLSCRERGRRRPHARPGSRRTERSRPRRWCCPPPVSGVRAAAIAPCSIERNLCSLAVDEPPDRA